MKMVYIPFRVGPALPSTVTAVGIVAAMRIGAVEGARAVDTGVGRRRAVTAAHSALSLIEELTALAGSGDAREVRGLGRAGDGRDDLPPGVEGVEAREDHHSPEDAVAALPAVVLAVVVA